MKPSCAVPNLTWDNSQFAGAVFISGNSLRLLHQHHTKTLIRQERREPIKRLTFSNLSFFKVRGVIHTGWGNQSVVCALFICSASVCVCNHLMLKLAGVSAADRDDAAIHVQLADDGHAPFQLRTEGLRGAAAQTQQANQNVLLRILVGEEGLPAAVGHVIPPHQLHLNTHIFVSKCPELYNSTSINRKSVDFQLCKSDCTSFPGCCLLPGKVWLCGGSPECPLLWFSRLDTAHRERFEM